MAVRSSMGGDAALTLFEEADDGFGLAGSGVRFQYCQCLTDIKIAMVDRFVCLFDGRSAISRDSGTPQANAIEADDAGRVAITGHIGGDVFHHFAATGHHGVVANKAELMYRDQAGDKDPITQFHMTCDGAVGAEYIVIAEMAIMAGMEAAHEVVVVTDLCPTFCLYATTDVDPLLEVIVAANYQGSAFLCRETQILGFAAEYRAVIHAVILSHPRALEDTYTALDLAATANDHSGFDNRIGSNLHAVVKLGAWINKGGRMNGHDIFCWLRLLRFWRCSRSLLY